MASIYPSSTSSTSSTSSANLLRISGMASGIDTDAVVKSMVSNYQAKIDKANQSKELLQWKQEYYRDIIKDIKGLQDYFDPLSSKYILSGNSLNINTAASGDTSIVSATAGSAAKTGTYKVHVSQLAEQAKITGTKSLNSLVNMNDANALPVKWNGATLNLDTNLKLNAITDTSGDGSSLDETIASINSKIASDSTLNGKVTAVLNGSNIEFKTTNNKPVTLTLTSSDGSSTFKTSIPANSSCSVSSSDFSAWSNANLTLGNSITLDNTIANTDTNASGNTIDEITANINSKISQNSILNGKVSVSYVDDGSGNKYIKFIGTSSMSLTATTFGGTAGDIVSNKIVNSGTSLSTKLSDLGISTNSAFSLSYGSTTVQISAKSSDTLQSLIDQVNSKTSGAVTMSVDDNTGMISFKSKSYGSSANIIISNLTGDIGQLGIVADSKTGKDALLEITEPGQTVSTTTTQSSNNFTVNGVTYNLVGSNEAGKTASVTVKANSDTVVSNMKKFIEDYNSVISKINTKLTEKKNRDYAPLTDAQKEDMGEDQIKAWEAKAKVGILRNDDYLSQLMTELRGIFSSPVYSSYTDSSQNAKLSLSFGQYGTGAIGIDTSKEHTDGGKLVLKDEAKLKSVIENNLDDFKKLFISASSKDLGDKESYTASKKYKEDGIFRRMDTILRSYVAAPGLGKDGTYTLSGLMNIFVNKQYDYSSSGASGKNTLPDQVYKKTISISKFQTQLSDAQTRYYAKFTALETAMNKLNAQQSQLSSMLGTA